jgi:YD repeat-containing protein
LTDAQTLSVRELRKIRYSYRLLSRLEPGAERPVCFTHDRQGQVVERVDPVGTATRYQRDRAGRVVTAVAGGRPAEQVERDSAGRVVRRITPEGETLIDRDALGRVVRQVDADGRVVEYAWSDRGLPLAVTVDGVRHRVLVDRLGQVHGVEAGGGRWRLWTFDAAGRVTAAYHGPGPADLDFAGVPDLVAAATRAVTRYRFDPAGRLVERRASTGRVDRYLYAGGPRPIRHERERVDGAGEPEVDLLQYDKAGRLVRRQRGPDAFDLYDYDWRGRLTRHVHRRGPTLRRTTCTYNAAGQIVAMTDRHGAVTRYEYRPDGQRHAVIHPDGSRVIDLYDHRGRHVGRSTRPAPADPFRPGR